MCFFQYWRKSLASASAAVVGNVCLTLLILLLALVVSPARLPCPSLPVLSCLSSRCVLSPTGNPLKAPILKEACYNLVYLELAACRLTSLPEGFGKLCPNVRVLNLNYNFLEDVRGLEDLTRMQKLTIIGSRLKSTKPLIRLVQRMPDVEMLDFR